MKTTRYCRPRAGEAGAAFAALVTVAMLAGCGGGGGSSAPVASDPPAPVPAPAPTTTAVQVNVIDGAIANALVCLDLNDNGACDSGEPTARTGTDGKAALDVPLAEAGKHAVVALVGTDAVDADHGPVTQAFVLKAPADQPGVVSPLTTLVQAQAASTGSTTADAEAYLRTVTGLSVSLLSDYTQAAGGATSQAGTLARLVVLATQQQAQALASVIGSTDLSGAPITTSDVAGAVTSAVAAQLPALAAAAVDPAVASATDRATALATAAQDVVDGSGLTAATAAGQIGASRLAAQAAAEPAVTAAAAPGTNTRMFRYVDANNWSYRTFPSTAADNTPDAAGRRTFYDLHAANVAGTTTTWGFGTSSGNKDDLHWDGSGWTACPLGTRGFATRFNANATTFDSDYCNAYSVNRIQRSTLDVSGQTMTSVIQKIRGYPGGDSGVLYANWGPVDLGLLGMATFPAGSSLYVQISNATKLSAQGYTPTSAAVTVANAALALGGDTRTAGGGACVGVTNANVGTVLITPTTLEAMVAGATGKPCIYGQDTAADGSKGLPANEWWTAQSISVGTVTNAIARPDGTGTYFTTSANVRVAFTGGTGITWYSCLIRASDSAVRNCFAIGQGSYTIETLGDARVMSFAGMPALAAKVSNQRVMIERGGKVYAGYRNWPAANTVQVGLNLTATNALFNALGVPAVVPQ